MADDVVDSLSIQFNAETKNAVKSIDSLVTSLGKLSTVLNHFGADFSDNLEFEKAKRQAAELDKVVARTAKHIAEEHGFEKSSQSVNALAGALKRLAKAAMDSKTFRLEDIAKSFDLDDMSFFEKTDFEEAWENARDVIGGFITVTDVAAEQYKDLIETIRKASVKLDTKTLSSLGENWKKDRLKLGAGWGSKNGANTSAEDFLMDNKEIADAIGYISGMTDTDIVIRLVDFVERYSQSMMTLNEAARQGKDASGEMEEVGNNIFDFMTEIASFSQQSNDFAQNAPTSVGMVVDLLKEFSGIVIPDTAHIAQLGTALSVLANTNMARVGTNLQSMIPPLTQLLNLLNSTAFIDTEGIAKLIAAMGKFGNKSFIASSQALPVFADNLKLLFSTIATAPDMSIMTDFIRILSRFGGKAFTESVDAIPMFAASLQMLIDALSNMDLPDVSGLAEIISSLRAFGNASFERAAATLPVFAGGLQTFFDVISNVQIPDMESLTELIKNLSKFGGASFQRATTILPEFSNELQKVIDTASRATGGGGNIFKSFSGVSKAKNFGNSFKKAAPHVSNFTRGIKSLNIHLPHMAKHAGNASVKIQGLGRTFTKAMIASRALIAAAKRLWSTFADGIKLASDLTEVQNVVDKAFGNEAEKVDALVENSIKTLGMSELTVKQIASRYQAMGSAMGITNGQVAKATSQLPELKKGYDDTASSMADMSLNLTRLAADMASFYNVEVDDVAEDLQAVFTGQTRPLMLAA